VDSVREAPEKAPDGLGAEALALWSSVVDGYDLDEHERTLLVQAVRTVDLLEKLDEEVRRDGPLVESPQGQKAHPAATEARQQRIALARLLAALRLPAGDEGDQQAGARPQRRVGVRGTYGIRGVAR
jgi:phage terminase small subunit